VASGEKVRRVVFLWTKKKGGVRSGKPVWMGLGPDRKRKKRINRMGELGHEKEGGVLPDEIQPGTLKKVLKKKNSRCNR